MGAESRYEVLGLFREKFGERGEDPVIQTLEDVDPSELTQRHYDAALAYASTIGEEYGKHLPERDVTAAFSSEVGIVAQDFVEKAQAGDGVYFNALSELGLVLQVDAAFATADMERIVPFGNEVGKEQKRFRADLEGIKMTMQALESSNGLQQGSYYQIDVKRALWEFDHNGIRLTVYYDDPVTGAKREIKARMDFHYRDSGEYKDRPQAALDLEGAQMSRALRLSGKDYHRGELLPGAIQRRAEFERLRQGRIELAQALAQQEYSGS